MSSDVPFFILIFHTISPVLRGILVSLVATLYMLCKAGESRAVSLMQAVRNGSASTSSGVADRQMMASSSERSWGQEGPLARWSRIKETVTDTVSWPADLKQRINQRKKATEENNRQERTRNVKICARISSSIILWSSKSFFERLSLTEQVRRSEIRGRTKKRHALT
jgi:hypothetical protein